MPSYDSFRLTEKQIDYLLSKQNFTDEQIEQFRQDYYPVAKAFEDLRQIGGGAEPCIPDYSEAVDALRALVRKYPFLGLHVGITL